MAIVTLMEDDSDSKPLPSTPEGRDSDVQTDINVKAPSNSSSASGDQETLISPSILGLPTKLAQGPGFPESPWHHVSGT